MAMLNAEISLKFVARLQSRAQERPADSIVPTGAYPGSPEKISALTDRASKQLPLHHTRDGRLPLGQAWRIWVGPNGRIVAKLLVSQDRAGIIVLAPKLSAEILREIETEFGTRHYPILGCEPPEPPPARRAA